MKHERVDLLDPKYDVDRANLPGRPAGIYWLDGACVLACHGSRAEQRLLDRGAIHVATLRFRPDLREGSHPERPVTPLRAEQLVELPAAG